MTAEIFAAWLKRQGYQVARTKSSYWVNMGKRVWQAFPYHWIIQPDETEVHEFLRTQGALGLRYSTPLEAPRGCISYHAVYDKPTYLLEKLGKKARYDVRQGMKQAEIAKISFAQLGEAGWQLYVDTCNRQRRQVSINQDGWRLMWQAAADLPGFEVWGAVHGSCLLAAAVAFQSEDCYYILWHMSHRDFLHLKVNNALVAFLTGETLKNHTIKLICYGLHSLDAPPSVDEFKFRMGYLPKPVRQRVVFHPAVQPLVNAATHKLLQRLITLFPGQGTLTKAEGMMRFYLEGLKPLAEQTWPQCLAARKAEILQNL